MLAMSKKQQEQAAPEAPSEIMRRSCQIGVSLRFVYDEVADQPLPDRFTKLLEKLKRGET